MEVPAVAVRHALAARRRRTIRIEEGSGENDPTASELRENAGKATDVAEDEGTLAWADGTYDPGRCRFAHGSPLLFRPECPPIIWPSLRSAPCAGGRSTGILCGAPDGYGSALPRRAACGPPKEPGFGGPLATGVCTCGDDGCVSMGGPSCWSWSLPTPCAPIISSSRLFCLDFSLYFWRSSSWSRSSASFSAWSLLTLSFSRVYAPQTSRIFFIALAFISSFERAMSCFSQISGSLSWSR